MFKKKLMNIGAVLAVSMATGGLSAIAKQGPADFTKLQGETLNYSNQRALDFNKDWTFYNEVQKNEFDSAKVKPYETNFNDSSWDRVNLPYDWSIYKDFETSVSPEIAHLPGGTGWYRKVFFVPESMKGKEISINFDGVYQDSDTYINGELLGHYPNGYVGFSYDLTDKLNYGNEANILTVKAVNSTEYSKQNSRWYSGSGIYRDVELIIQESVKVKKNGTAIYLPDLKENHTKDPNNFDATVNVKNTIQNTTDSAKEITVKTSLYDYYTNEEVKDVQAQEAKTTVSANSELVFETNLKVHNPILWEVVKNPKSPKSQLYNVKTEIILDGKVVETKYDRFGFRYFDWYSVNTAKAQGNVHEGFYLNGKYVRFEGVCMHSDNGSLGAEAYDDATYRQMAVMKSMGVNAIRITHNSADPNIIRFCDELGLLVIEEFYDMWYTSKSSGKYNYPESYIKDFEKTATHPDAQNNETWAQFDMQSIIKRDRNYPSIIMWSTGNEIPEMSGNSEKVQKTVANLNKWGHEVEIGPDWTSSRNAGQARYVSIGANDLQQSPNGLFDAFDSVGANYNTYTYVTKDEVRKNSFLFYASETSSAVKSRGYYSQNGENKGNGMYSLSQGPTNVGNQMSSFDNAKVGWGLTASESFRRMQETSEFAGEFIWTGFDYLGEPTPWNIVTNVRDPHKSYFGTVDTAGFAKDDFYLYQSQWLSFEEFPMVHIVGHNNWEDENLYNNQKNSDGTIPIRVYTNAPKVELYKQAPGGQLEKVGDTKEFVKKQLISSSLTNSQTMIEYQRAKDNDKNLYVQWNVPRETVIGTKLIAKIFDESGKEVEPQKVDINKSNSEITMAGKATKIKLTPEKTIVQPDGYSLIYVDVELQDKDGNFVPTANGQVINFKSFGDSLEIVSTDNGNSDSWERYRGFNGVFNREIFNGRALVVLKSKTKEGVNFLQATGTGLESDQVTLFVEGDRTSKNLDHDSRYSMTNSTQDVFKNLYFKESKRKGSK